MLKFKLGCYTRRGASMVDDVLQARFGRGRAQSHLWRDGAGSGRDAVAWSATNRAAAARICRCDERRRFRSVLLARAQPGSARAQERGKDELDGKLPACAEEKSGVGAQLPTRGVARRRPAAVWRRASTVEEQEENCLLV